MKGIAESPGPKITLSLFPELVKIRAAALCTQNPRENPDSNRGVKCLQPARVTNLWVHDPDYRQAVDEGTHPGNSQYQKGTISGNI